MRKAGHVYGHCVLFSACCLWLSLFSLSRVSVYCSKCFLLFERTYNHTTRSRRARGDFSFLTFGVQALSCSRPFSVSPCILSCRSGQTNHLSRDWLLVLSFAISARNRRVRPAGWPRIILGDSQGPSHCTLKFRFNTTGDTMSDTMCDTFSRSRSDWNCHFSACYFQPTSSTDGKATFSLNCRQDRCHLRRPGTNMEKKRSSNALAFDCDGALSFTLHSSGLVEFGQYHHLIHEILASSIVSDSIITWIQTHSLLRAAEIGVLLHQMYVEGNLPETTYVTPGQIRHHLATAQVSKYKHHEDPIKSALLFFGMEVICRGMEHGHKWNDIGHHSTFHESYWPSTVWERFLRGQHL